MPILTSTSTPSSFAADLLAAEAAAWHARAADLAGWVCRHLLNRIDAWGAYAANGTYTAPAVRDRGRVVLGPSRIARHFRARQRGDLVGLHSTSSDNASRWAALDIDHHGDGAAPPVLLDAARGWYGRLRSLGFRPLLEDSNGRGGYHLWTIFAEPVPTPLAYAFARRLSDDRGSYGLAARPEAFPKQPRIEPTQFGNWLRLPGHHPSRDHVSRFWDGDRWLSGREAVDYILSVTGDSPALVPAEVTPPPPPVPPRPRRLVFTGPVVVPADRLQARCAAYLAKLPNLAQGQGRDDVAYHYAAFLVRDLQLPDEVALLWLERWDRGNNPPKGEARLRQIIADAHQYGKNGYGSGLERFAWNHGPTPRR